MKNSTEMPRPPSSVVTTCVRRTRPSARLSVATTPRSRRPRTMSWRAEGRLTHGARQQRDLPPEVVNPTSRAAAAPPAKRSSVSPYGCERRTVPLPAHTRFHDAAYRSGRPNSSACPQIDSRDVGTPSEPPAQSESRAGLRVHLDECPCRIASISGTTGSLSPFDHRSSDAVSMLMTGCGAPPASPARSHSDPPRSPRRQPLQFDDFFPTARPKRIRGWRFSTAAFRSRSFQRLWIPRVAVEGRV
jgi:hypothetical protein